MATRFILDGEIASLSQRQQEFICDVIEKRGYIDNKIQVESVGKAGDNFVAYVKRITVHGNDGDTFKIIAKIAPTHEIARTTTGVVSMFINEIKIYTEVLPKFAQLQRAAHVPEEEWLQYAECYGVLTEEPDELILLEDLQTSNFQMLDRFKPLTSESVKLILKNFAILHSLSFVLREKEPETFEHFSTKLFDYFDFIDSVPDFHDYLSRLENDTLLILDNEKNKNAVRNSLIQMSALTKNVSELEGGSRYTVVAHGDAWTNNIMFRFEDAKIVEAILIDYQMSKVTSPVADLFYMIFNSTDHSTRSHHYYDWIEYYHIILDKSLSNYGLNVNCVYSRDQLDADIKRYSKLFLGRTIMLISVIIRKTEDSAKLKEAIDVGAIVEPEKLQISALDSDSVTLFKKRVEDLINSFREFGFVE